MIEEMEDGLIQWLSLEVRKMTEMAYDTFKLALSPRFMPHVP